MNRRGHKKNGFTLLELMLTAAIIALLASLVLPVIGKAQRRSRQTQCASQLRQIGLASHLFAHEHNNYFPAQVSTNAGGTMEFVLAAVQLGGDSFFAWRHFQALSNELVTPRLLHCPTDLRAAASNFTTLRNEHLSYFISTSAQMTQPESVLAGDRNLVVGGGAIVLIGSNTPVSWTAELHEFRGNLLFADGHAEGFTGAGLVAAFERSPAANDVVLPPVTSAAGSAGSTGGRAGTSSTAGRSGPHGSGRGGGTGQSSASNVGGGLAELERVFQAANSPSAQSTAGGRAPGVGGKRTAQSETNLPGTNQPAASTAPETNTAPAAMAAPAREGEVTDSEDWPASLARYLGKAGYRFTYLFLFIVLAILLAMEWQRRRRKPPPGMEE